MKPAVVVGGGIAGMLAAWLLAERGESVMLLEASDNPGGLLQTSTDATGLRFDFGPHLFSETGEEQLDRRLLSLLPESEWLFHRNTRRDLAGAYFAGGVQLNSPYPDVRRLGKIVRDRCVAGYFSSLETRTVAPPDATPVSAGELARQRFGDPITELVIAPIIRAYYGCEPDALSTFALSLLPLGRVILFDPDLMTRLMEATVVREGLAFPDQRSLPAQYASPRATFYPRRFGIGGVMSAFAQRLRESGVRILTGATVTRVEAEKKQIAAVEYRHQGVDTAIADPRRVVWSAGSAGLARALGLAGLGIDLDRPRRTVLVNLVCSEPPAMGDLFYLHNFEAAMNTFRVTRFGAYCPDADRQGEFTVCIEYRLPQSDNDPQVGDDALAELESMRLVDPARARVSGITPLPYAFPMPTIRNFAALDALNLSIRSLELGNLDLVGAMSRPGLFFQSDVMLDAYRTLAA